MLVCPREYPECPRCEDPESDTSQSRWCEECRDAEVKPRDCNWCGADVIGPKGTLCKDCQPAALGPSQEAAPTPLARGCSSAGFRPVPLVSVVETLRAWVSLLEDANGTNAIQAASALDEARGMIEAAMPLIRGL